MSLADPLDPSHRGDELVAEQQFASTLDAALIADLARAVADLSDAREIILAACSARDALRAERDQLISSLNLEKGAATLLLAERDRLASQCATLRTLLADTRPAIVARAATSPLGLDESLLPRIDQALASP